MKRIVTAAVALTVLACATRVRAQEVPAFEPGIKTSYEQVTKHLNTGGDTFIYQSAAQWGATLDALLPPLRNLVVATVGRRDREGAEVAFHFIEAFLKDSGLQALTGVGTSSIPIGGGLHHNRVYFGHGEGEAKGLLWDAFMPDNTPLPLLKALPPDTVLATRIPVRGDVAWKWVKKTVGSLANEQAKREIEEELFQEFREEGVDLDKWFASLGEGLGVVLTLVPKPAGAPKPEGGPEAIMMDLVGRASLAILVEVKDDTIFDALEAIFQKANAPMKRQDSGTIRALVMQGRLPVPGRGPLAIARFGKYLAFASNDQILKALSEGKGGLTDTDEFKRIAAKLPREGMGFSYLNARLGDELSAAIEQTGTGRQRESRGILVAHPLVMTGASQLNGQASYAVSVRTKDGALAMNTATFGLAKAIVGKTVIGPMAMLGPVFTMKLRTAREKAQRMSDLSKLKQIGTGLTMYSNEFDERFPDDLGELIDKDYVKSGRCYINPRSGTKPPRTGDQLRAGQCDYLYFGKGLTTDNSGTETPIACTKPGLFSKTYINVLYADGHVQGHAHMPPEVKAAIARTKKKDVVVGKQDLSYAKIRGRKLGLHIAQTMPKARILLVVPPAPKGSAAEALLAGLLPALNRELRVGDLVILTPPEGAKDDAWFTGKLLNEQTAKFEGKVDLVITSMGLPEQGIQSLWFWKKGVKVAIPAGDVSRLQKAILAKLVVAAATPNPDVVPDDWQPPKDPEAAFAKRFLLITPENAQEMGKKHPKLFR